MGKQLGNFEPGFKKISYSVPWCWEVSLEGCSSVVKATLDSVEGRGEVEKHADTIHPQDRESAGGRQSSGGGHRVFSLSTDDPT